MTSRKKRPQADRRPVAFARIFQITRPLERQDCLGRADYLGASQPQCLWQIRTPSARQLPTHASTMVAGLDKKLDAMAVERGNDSVPHLPADVTVAAFFGNVQLATDLEPMHGSHGDAGGLGQLGEGELGLGGRGIGALTLRHTLASWAADTGAEMAKIHRALSHKTIKTTEQGVCENRG
jgi:integrase